MITNTTNEILTLQASIMEDLKQVAEAEGTTVNQLINVAVAEKLGALRTLQFFRERAARGSRETLLRLLEKAGTNEPPREGDELPAGWISERGQG